MTSKELTMEERVEIARHNKNKDYFVHDDLYNKTTRIQGDLMDLVRGVNYICDFYRGKKGFTQDKVLAAILKVMEIQRLRGFNETFYDIDSFIREQVFEIITRESNE